MQVMSGKLYIVGTPIGNLKDLSLRAVETLKNVDFISAEDTRVTLKLLNYLNFKKKIFSYFEHNKYEKSGFICKKILNGESCALVSDAGMPCVSDPGEHLVQECINLKIPVVVIPGPCAVSASLSLAGIFGTRFTFEGFLSVNKKERKKHLDEIKDEMRTMVFYESPHRLYQTLCDLYNCLGERDIVIVKELTKIHENANYTTLKEAVDYYNNKDLRGEYVIIVKNKKRKKNVSSSMEDAIKLHKLYLKSGKSNLEAVKIVSKELSIRKNDLYKEVLKKSINSEC